VSYLRHISTRQLLAVLVGCALAIGVGAAAIALAAGGTGTTPPPKPLADAIHDALAAPQPAGVTARIDFTNHLVDAASLQGADPLLTGAKGRLWASGDKLRLELQASDAGGGAGDVQVLLDGDHLTVIDPGANTVYRITLPNDANTPSGRQANDPVPSVARIQQALTSLSQDASVSGAQPDNVAGRPAYTVRVSPRHDGGLLGGVELAWDAEHGVPLRAAVFASGNGSPVLELRATDISFGPVAAADLTVPEPAGAKVVDLSPPAGGAGQTDGNGRQTVTGLDAVQAKVPFKVVAPDQLVGLKRQAVRLIDHGGSPGALVTYGQDLGGIAVIQTAAEPGKNGTAGIPGGPSLPKISINGASGEELDTALGTVLRFQRGGVAYTVLGSVPPTAAEAAARAL
jgi:outer membrane lipoprotein-sorting protein